MTPTTAVAAHTPSPGSSGRRRRTFRVGPWTAVVAFGLFAFAPIYWLLVTSITPDDEVYQYPPSLFPDTVTFSHYITVITDPQILGWLGNTVFVAGVTATLSVAVCMYMGYSISKFRYRGRQALLYFVLSSQMIPSALLLVTLYTLFSSFGLVNTYFALIVSFTTFTLPLCVWMLKGFFDTLPDDLIEAAAIDGATRLRTFHSVILPLAAPGLVAAGLFAFMRGWNDFIFALTLTGPERRTLPPALVGRSMGQASTDWPELMAASFLVALPVAIAFILLQRFLVGGITGGAVKG